MMRKRFLITLLTLVVIGVATSVAVFLAKGYRFSPQSNTVISGTGILSITSIPDQASVYVDGHLTTATNANINSLPPKEYNVKIVKEGFIPWEKKVEVKEGLVKEIKATLFRAIPSVYPLTYTGVENVSLAPDGQKIVYVVPGNEKKSGIWEWRMSERPIAFARGSEPHQIALPQDGVDYTKAEFRWSPETTQVLVMLGDRNLLLDDSKLNDPPRDITPILDPTLRSWDESQKLKDATSFEAIKNLTLRKTASSSAVLKWSPDETKILYSSNGKDDFKVTDLVLNKTYPMPKADHYAWLPDGEHLLIVEKQAELSPQPSVQNGINIANFSMGKVSVIEYDGSNKSEIYAGIFNHKSVFVWPDGSRFVLVSYLPTATASQPNMYGINLK